MSEEPLYQHRDNHSQEIPAASGHAPSRIWSTVLTVLITAFVTFSLTIGLGAAVLSAVGLTGLTGTLDLIPGLNTSDPETSAAVRKLREVFRLVDEDFVNDLSDAEMVEAMARGLISELDNPYTYYLSSEQNKQIAESMSGNYSGIGAVVSMNKDGLV